NGVEVASTNGTLTMFDSPGALTIGSRIGCSGEFNHQPVGTAIDEPQMFNIGLTAAQVAAMYNEYQGGLCVDGATCGNAITEAGELCDDGNTDNGDGCSSVCGGEICADDHADLSHLYKGENNTTDSNGTSNGTISGTVGYAAG